MDTSVKNSLDSPNFSFWEYDRWFRNIDLLVIGAGITGCLSAYFWKKKFPRDRVLVIDKNPLPCGATLRNAGFLCFGSVSEYLDDKSKHSEDYAAQLMLDRYEGIQIIKEVFKSRDIGLKLEGGFELFTAAEKDIFQDCADHILEVNTLFSNKKPFKVKLEHSTESGLSKSIQVIENELEANLDSGKLVSEFQKLLSSMEIDLIYGFPIDSVENHSTGVSIFSEGRQFHASKVMVATNAFTQSLLGHLDVVPNLGQILVTSPLPHLKRKGNYHYDAGYYYLRQLDSGAILLGGGRNLDFETERSNTMHINSKIQSALEDILKNVFLPGENFSIDHRWAGVMAFGSNNEKAPLTGALQNIHYIVRMGGMGVAMAPITVKRYIDSL
jgi:gamma-glutamylputrescine oxidase